MEAVPAIRLSHRTEAQARAYRLADNQLALTSTWDEALLAAELRALRSDEFDLGLIGFDGATLDQLLDGAWLHLMITDPPYGVNYDPEWRTKAGVSATMRTGKVTNDDRADWREAWRLFPCDVAYVWHAGVHALTVIESLGRVDKPAGGDSHRSADVIPSRSPAGRSALIRGRLSDEEWSFFEPFVMSACPLGGRPPRDHRRVLDAIFRIARTGAPWRDCRPSSATGTRCSAGSDAGAPPACGT